MLHLKMIYWTHHSQRMKFLNNDISGSAGNFLTRLATSDEIISYG